ncbi:MAG TPA: hypothetical protein VJ903_01805 [Clostridia bacterium]|nr:hypothetical protein [Clostridia bacterium]
MAKQTVDSNQDNILIPIKPATDNYRIPFVNDPSSFMMYGENALEQYNDEVKRVETELLKEIYGQEEEVVLEREKKVNFCSISALIISILVLAMLIIGRFLTISAIPDLFMIANGVDGLTYLLSFIEGMSDILDINALIVMIGIASTALFALISMIISIFTIKKAGTGIFMKICLFLSFTSSILIAMMLLITGKEIAIGLYVVIGMTFISTLIGFCSKGIVRKRIVK